jgi:hypothetical protein
VDVPHRATEQTFQFVVGGPPGAATVEATTVPGIALRRSFRVRPKK